MTPCAIDIKSFMDLHTEPFPSQTVRMGIADQKNQLLFTKSAQITLELDHPVAGVKFA